MKLVPVQLPDPYRILFPIGVLTSFVGIGFWWMFSIGHLEYFPRQAHANIMYFCFLWAFVAGFLMTAVPKMTTTASAHWIEHALASGLVVLQLFTNIFQQMSLSVFIFAVQNAFLIIFVGRRFLVYRRLPFEGFLFIPFALLQAFVAVILFFTDSSVSSEKFYLLAGEALILNLIVGLGTRLIPVLSHVPNALKPDQKAASSNWPRMLSQALLFNLGFWLQFFDYLTFGVGLRLLILIWVTIQGFKLFSSVSKKSFVGLGLRCGVVSIILSYVLMLVIPSEIMSVQHLMFIGGFVLITFMVGTRVMLAHGGQSLSYETESKRIGAVALLFIFASWFRLISGSHYLGIILKASIILFIAASILWLHKFLLVLAKQKSE